MKKDRLALGIGIAIGLVASSAFAQDAKQAPKRESRRTVRPAQPAKPGENNSPASPADGKPSGKSSSTATDAAQLPTQATIEMIMNEAVNNIARRYNLNDEQTKKTDEIMKREVNKFLKDHEADVWPIIRDLLSSNFGMNPSNNPDELKRIGKSAQPLLKLAKDAIYKGNEEWRKYLNDGQRSTHDYDLNEMDKTFSQIEENFQSWAEGKAVDGGIFPPPPPPNLSPPTPHRPPPGLPKPEVEIFVRTTLFDTVVEEFIKEYELNAAQIDAARSILSEFKAKAVDFKKANRAELSLIAHELGEATEAHDLDRVAKAEAERKRFMRPVYELFGEMDERLNALLTTLQIERHTSRQLGASEVKKADSKDKDAPAAEKGVSDASPKPVTGQTVDAAKPNPVSEDKQQTP